jgi:hypothetical protein
LFHIQRFRELADDFVGIAAQILRPDDDPPWGGERSRLEIRWQV